MASVAAFFVSSDQFFGCIHSRAIFVNLRDVMVSMPSRVLMYAIYATLAAHCYLITIKAVFFQAKENS
jgi:hypothetical protein